MKKNLVVVMFVIITLLMSGSVMYGDSGDDFKVIKNGVKNKSGKVQYLRVTVYNKLKKKNTVKIKVPISLFEFIADCTKDDIKINSKCDFDLKKILKALRRNGPMTLVEIDEEDEIVKVWFE